MKEQYDYCVAEAESIYDLEAKVEELMMNGWITTGGISSYHDSKIHFVQALVKEED